MNMKKIALYALTGVLLGILAGAILCQAYPFDGKAGYLWTDVIYYAQYGGILGVILPLASGWGLTMTRQEFFRQLAEYSWWRWVLGGALVSLILWLASYEQINMLAQLDWFDRSGCYPPGGVNPQRCWAVPVTLPWELEIFQPVLMAIIGGLLGISSRLFVKAVVLGR